MVEITNESRDPNSENLKSDALFDETSLSVEAQRLERSTLRRLDSILIPLTLMLYLLAWLDRANVGNARVAGLEKDLNLSDHQYKTAITVTYVPYILAELPSNLLLKAVGPRILLPVLCTGWGTVTVLQSQIHNYEGFLACRFFLGLLEGGLFPGIVLYLAGFYRRHELQMRIAFFFSAASLSGAFSGLLAAAIQQMDGMRGLRGWQWIFLLEGLFTVCFGIVSFFLLPNGPDSVMTFTPQHIEHCVARLRLDQNFLENEKVTWKEVISVLADLHVWVACFALFCSGCCLFGLAYFSPSIVQALGYGSTKTQLMTVPPYACAFVVTMICAFFADRYRQRGLCAFITFGIALIGAALALNAKGTGQRYAALVLLLTGTFACAPCLISWVPNNTAGHVRRATAVAMAFIATNTGGILSTWIYPKSSAPHFRMGTMVNISVISTGMALVAGQVLLLKWLNNRKSVRATDEATRGEPMTPEQQLAMSGDRHPDYRYTY